MLLRAVVALVLLAVAGGVAWRLERRPRRHATRDAVPVHDRARVPAQLDRADFARPDAPWLLVLFSSKECGGCAEMATKVAVLETDEVAVTEVEYTAQKDLQDKYSIDSVPLVVVADSDGVVRAHAFGNVPASEVWSAVAQARGAAGESPRPRGG